MHKVLYCIALKLPDGINYYCGKVKIEGYPVDEWDTDINYALLFHHKRNAKLVLSNLKRSPGQESSKVKSYHNELIRWQRKNLKKVT